jgi:hypothetical protein
MEKRSFTIDSLANQKFQGFTSGETWNGWACPYFTFEEAKKIVDAQNANSDHSAHYDESNDTFVFSFSDDEKEGYSAENIDGEKLYGIGCGSWIWAEVE